MENNIKICERPILKCKYMTETGHNAISCCFPPNDFFEYGKCWEGGCCHFEAELIATDNEVEKNQKKYLRK